MPLKDRRHPWADWYWIYGIYGIYCQSYFWKRVLLNHEFDFKRRSRKAFILDGKRSKLVRNLVLDWWDLCCQKGPLQFVKQFESHRKTSPMTLAKSPNCCPGLNDFQNCAMTPARSPKWRCGTQPDSQIGYFYLDYLSNIAFYVVHDVFTKKVSIILFPACH